jgi:integral membrane protein (TIGR01906 family)
MKHKEYHDKLIVILFAIALFIIIIFGSLNLMVFNKEFYYKEYSKNNVYDKLPSDIDAEAVTDNMMKYFRGKVELQYFARDEKGHMADVKHLIRTMQLIYYGAAVVCIALFVYSYNKFKEHAHEFIRIISKAALYSSIAAIIFLMLTFLMAVFSFDFLFVIFHMIFFPQGNWMFSPDSLLITLFPQQFFFDISLRIFIYAMFQALIFFGIGYWIRKQLKMIEKYHH